MTETIKLSNLDTHFADFIVRIDRHPGNGLWWGAALASYFAGRGHSCFTLSDAPDAAAVLLLHTPRTPPPSDARTWREDLKLCDSVGAPGTYTPLVLDGAGRLYLHRCWRYEQQVAAGILSRSRPPEINELRIDDALDRYFPPGAVLLICSAQLPGWR